MFASQSVYVYKLQHLLNFSVNYGQDRPTVDEVFPLASIAVNSCVVPAPQNTLKVREMLPLLSALVGVLDVDEPPELGPELERLVILMVTWLLGRKPEPEILNSPRLCPKKRSNSTDILGAEVGGGLDDAPLQETYV